MKKVLAICLGLIVLASWAWAEPILTEQVKTVPANNLEIGLACSYGVDTWDWEDASQAGSSKVSLTTVQVPIKYGVNDKLQLNLNIPYRAWDSSIEFGGATATADDSGIGQVSVGAKYALNDMLAVGLDIQTPTGDVDKGLGEGTNVGVLLACQKEFKPVIIHGNLGYLYKSEYEDEHDVKHDPADPIIIRAAVEYPLNMLTPFAEAQVQFLGKSKTAGIDIPDSSGSTIDFLVGSQYQKDNLKAKLGLEFAAGDEDLRGGTFQFYDSWDWKIIASVSYMFNLMGGGK